jgi:TolB protein
MLTYDPAANTSTVLLGPPINGGGVTDARLYRGQE